MSHILEVQEDGTKRAVVVGSTGVYTVYQSEEDGIITVSAGAPGAEPLVRQQLGSHQQGQADTLFSKLCSLLGAGKTVINLSDYAMTSVEDEEPPADEEADSEVEDQG